MTETARDLAYQALTDRKGNVTAHLERRLAEVELSPAERGLARELALGVVRRRGTLEAVLAAYLRRPKAKMPRAARTLLHLGLYQVLMLERVPDFAAVDETVSRARRMGKGVSGMVNGILRSVCREVSDIRPGPAPRDRRAVPITPDTHRTFDRDVLADPADDLAGWLAGAYSLPVELADSWLEQFKTGRAVSAAAAGICRPPLICRVNSLKSTVADALSALSAEGVGARAHRNGLSVVLEGDPPPVERIEAFRSGLIQPQDPTATAVVAGCGVGPGMTVLDLCAAPGTKTTHLAERMGGAGQIIAVDVSDDKLRRIEDNCRRMGIENVETRPAESIGGLEPGSFDVVLADVPCSNTGVLARRPEARWRFQADLLDRLAGDQGQLAQAAAAFVKPGGQLVYSTCSIQDRENGRIVDALCRRLSSVRCIGRSVTLPAGATDPADWHDGGFAAIMEVH